MLTFEVLVELFHIQKLVTQSAQELGHPKHVHVDRTERQVGWKKDFVLKSTPVLPISGWVGDNLLKKSTNMAWWSGCDIEVEAKSGTEKLHIDCLYDCLNNMARPPVRPADSAMRLPVSGIYKIKGVGDVVAGRVEQGTVKPGEEVCFLPTHTASNPCGGKVFTVEMHHKRQESAGPGDNIGMNIKGLDKQNMPRSGDVIIVVDLTQEGVRGWLVNQILEIPVLGCTKVEKSLQINVFVCH